MPGPAPPLAHHFEQGHPGGHRGIEGANPAAHGDGEKAVAVPAHVGAQAFAFAADHQGQVTAKVGSVKRFGAFSPARP